MYYKPRIDKELLAQHSAGLIGLSGCLKGEVTQAIIAGRLPKARELAAQYRDILGAENFFLEMHDHGIEAQLKVQPRAAAARARISGSDWWRRTTCISSNETHHEAHDVMICIGTGANVTDERRMKYVPEVYFKSPAEMRALFARASRRPATTRWRSPSAAT